MSAPPIDPLVIEAFCYLGIGYLLVGFRIFCRVRAGGWSSLAADDYIMAFALLPYTVETSLSYTVGMIYHGLANSAMTDEQRAALSPDSEEYRLRVGGSINAVVGWSMFTVVVFTVKGSMCAYYSRLTAGLMKYKYRIIAGYGLIILSCLACLICILFSCQPTHKLWQINPYPGNLCQPAVNRLNIYMSLFTNMITDVYLMLIPLPLVWGAQIPKLKKGGLLLLFSGGIFIIVAGILRSVFILQNEVTGPRAAAAWAVREMFVTVVITNLPMTWSWIRQRLHPYFKSLISLNKSSGYQSAPEPGSYRLGDVNQHSWRNQSNKSEIHTKSAHSHGRNDVFIQTGDGSSEQIIPMGSTGIKKEVEFTVSTHETEMPEATYRSHNRRDLI